MSTVAAAPAGAARWRYPYDPQPKQALAHRTWAKERFYGGAAGGGKTDWLLAEVLRPVLQHGLPGLILRNTFADLSQSEGIIERLLERIPRSVGRYNDGKHLWRFKGGGTLQLGFLEHDADVQRYVGGQYGVIGWDQLEFFTEWQFRRMFHPLRLSEEHRAIRAGFVPYMVATGNPGGPGHMWVKGRYIDPAPPYVVWQPAPTRDERQPGTRCFIPAFLDDNKYLGEDYERQLEAMDEELYRALRWGDWDVDAGTRFGRLFRRDIHVIDPEDFPIPAGSGVPRFCGIDYGLEAPWCALYGALFPDGLIVVYRELYEAGLTPEEQAKLMRSVEIPVGERGAGVPVRTALDPSCWARNPNEPGDRKPAGVVASSAGSAPKGSIAHTYQVNGVPVVRANNDRRSGTARLAQKLKIQADGRPRLLIYSTCTNLIRTLPGCPRDKSDPELYERSGVAEQHALDALRYKVMEADPGPPAGQPAGRRRPDDDRGAGGLAAESAGMRDRGF